MTSIFDKFRQKPKGTKRYKADMPFQTRDTKDGHVLSKVEEENIIKKLDYQKQFGNRQQRKDAIKELDRLHFRSKVK